MGSGFQLLKCIDKYLKYMEYIQSSSRHTLRGYGKDLSQAFESDKYSGKEFWSEEDILHAVRMAFNQWAHLALSSRNRKAATLKSFLSWAFNEGLVDRDLSLGISCPKVPKKIPHFLSVDETLAVLKTLDSPSLLRERVLFLLLYGGGLRISEACQLSWRQVQFSQRSLRVIGNGKERMITVPRVVTESLGLWKKQSSATEFVFGEKPLNPRTAYEIIRHCGVRALLLKPLHPHALRHSYATHLLSSGANLRTLQELLGHESLQATEKYTHLGIDKLARTMEKLHPLGTENNDSKK